MRQHSNMTQTDNHLAFMSLYKTIKKQVHITILMLGTISTLSYEI